MVGAPLTQLLFAVDNRGFERRADCDLHLGLQYCCTHSEKVLLMFTKKLQTASNIKNYKDFELAVKHKVM